MKHIMLFVAVVFLFSCGSHENWEKNMIKHNRSVLENSFETGDVHSAIYAIQSLLVLDTVNVGLLDTLMNLYLQVGDFGSVFTTSNKIVQLEPENKMALEAHGRSSAMLKRSQDAFDTYLKLYDLEKNTRYLYEIVVQMYNAGNVAEGEKVLATIINSERSRTDMYAYKLANNQIIQVPVLAQTYYFIGTLRAAQGNIEEAISLLEKSIAVFPNFGIARAKLQELKS